jgi:hypothetical protein
MQNGMYMTFKVSFISENRIVLNWMQNFNPNIPLLKTEVYYDTQKSGITTVSNPNGIKIGEYKMTRIE